MHVRVPFPVWAMNPDEARHDRSGNLPNSSTDNFSDLIDE
jgi:hypothetical protein